MKRTEAAWSVKKIDNRPDLCLIGSMYPIRELPTARYPFWAGAAGVAVLWISLRHPEPADPGLYILNTALLAGFASALATYYLVKKTMPHFSGRSDAFESAVVFGLGVFICFWILAAGLFNLINWQFASPPESRVFQVTDIRRSGASSEKSPISPFRIMLSRGKNDTRLMEIGVPEIVFQQARIGDRFQLTMRPGRLFGTYVVKTLNIVPGDN